MDVRHELALLDEAWVNTEIPAGGSSCLPDGTYQVKIEAARIVERKDGSGIMLVMELECLHGNYEGRTHTHIRSIDGDQLQWLKKELSVCGVEMEYLSELPDRLEDLLDNVVEIKVKTNKKNDKEYVNTYFNRSVKTGEWADGDTPF